MADSELDPTQCVLVLCRYAVVRAQFPWSSHSGISEEFPDCTWQRWWVRVMCKQAANQAVNWLVPDLPGASLAWQCSAQLQYIIIIFSVLRPQFTKKDQCLQPCHFQEKLSDDSWWRLRVIRPWQLLHTVFWLIHNERHFLAETRRHLRT